MALNVLVDDKIQLDEVLEVYSKNHWSSASKPDQLLRGLRGSDCLVTARMDGKLVGLGNAIADGALVVYYPHLLVHPDFQGKGIGKKIMCVLMDRYQGFHQHMLVSDKDTIGFYEASGFAKAGSTVPMWIYQGQDH